MTDRKVAWFKFPVLGSLFPADIFRQGAARVEGAARRRKQGAGQIAPQGALLSPAKWIRNGDGVEQRPGVWVQGIAKQHLFGAALHHPAQIHHRHLVADVLYHAEIVGNEQE